MITSLYQIDRDLLEVGIAKLDLSKKTPLKKVIIEYENLTKKGKSMQVNITANEDSKSHLST